MDDHCQGCGQEADTNLCDHDKTICPDCWPDTCWACGAYSEEIA